MSDIKQTFNELSQLASVLDQWGAGVKDHMPFMCSLSVVFHAVVEKMTTPKDQEYTVIDHSNYHNLLKNGPEKKGYEASVEILKKTLASGNGNTLALLRFMRGSKARSYMPEVENKQELQALAKKHKLKCFKKLLK